MATIKNVDSNILKHKTDFIQLYSDYNFIQLSSDSKKNKRQTSDEKNLRDNFYQLYVQQDDQE